MTRLPCRFCFRECFPDGGKNENRNGDCAYSPGANVSCLWAERISAVHSGEEPAAGAGGRVLDDSIPVTLGLGSQRISSGWRRASIGESLRAAGAGNTGSSDCEYHYLSLAVAAQRGATGDCCDDLLVFTVLPVPAIFYESVCDE